MITKKSSSALYSSSPATLSLSIPAKFPPSGTWVRFVNDNFPILTIQGKTNHGARIALNKGESVYIVSDNNERTGGL